jgi:CelD/BcsL family acetyltransferase involved in cellulose biosynthesis
MTQLLKRAFEQASQLPEEEQDEFARLILSELESEGQWSDLFARPESEDLLERLADEALADHRAGRTAPLDPEDL